MITETGLIKLLSSAADACKKAEGGDGAEEGRAVDALKVLGQQQVTADLLAKTAAGKKLKTLSKHKCSAISEAAAAAVEAWKACVRQEQHRTSSKPEENSSRGDGTPAPESQPEQSGSQGPNDASTSGRDLQRSTSNKLVIGEPARTGDDTRDKIRKLLAEALAASLSEGVFGDPCAVAVDVEEAMFVQNGGVNAKYKAKYRSLSFNLKDPKNPDLRARVCVHAWGTLHGESWTGKGTGAEQGGCSCVPGWVCVCGGGGACGPCLTLMGLAWCESTRSACTQLHDTCAQLCIHVRVWRAGNPMQSTHSKSHFDLPSLQVLQGQIPGDVLVNLSAEELASNEMRAKNDSVCVYVCVCGGVGCGVQRHVCCCAGDGMVVCNVYVCVRAC